MLMPNSAQGKIKEELVLFLSLLLLFQKLLLQFDVCRIITIRLREESMH